MIYMIERDLKIHEVASSSVHEASRIHVGSGKKSHPEEV